MRGQFTLLHIHWSIPILVAHMRAMYSSSGEKLCSCRTIRNSGQCASASMLKLAKNGFDSTPICSQRRHKVTRIQIKELLAVAHKSIPCDPHQIPRLYGMDIITIHIHSGTYMYYRTLCGYMDTKHKSTYMYLCTCQAKKDFWCGCVGTSPAK